MNGEKWAHEEMILAANLNKNRTKDYFVKYFAPIENAKLTMPQKCFPKREFLEWHRDMVFEKSKKNSNFAKIF